MWTDFNTQAVSSEVGTQVPQYQGTSARVPIDSTSINR